VCGTSTIVDVRRLKVKSFSFCRTCKHFPGTQRMSGQDDKPECHSSLEIKRELPSV